MARRPLALLALAFLSSCFSLPTPDCVFVCGADGHCPPSYVCVPDDNMCHLVVNGATATCPASATPDAAPVEMVDAPPEMVDAPPEMVDARPGDAP